MTRDALFEGHPDSMFVYAVEDLRILDVNRAAVERYGYAREEFLRLTMKDIRTDEDHERLERAIRWSPPGLDRVGIWRHRKKSGDVVFVDIAARAIVFEGVPARLLTARDVTHLMNLEGENAELLQGERELRREAQDAAARFQSLFEAVPGRFLVLTPHDYEIVAVSDDFLDVTMTRRDRIIGRHFFDVFPRDPSDPYGTGVDNLRASLARVETTRAPDVMHVQYYPIPRAQSGGFEARYWSPVNSPVLGPDGSVTLIIHRTEDVTEFVQTAQASAARELAEQGDSEVDLNESSLAVLLRSRDLRVANNRLLEQEANLRTAQRLLGIGLWKMDVVSGVMNWSDNVFDMYGLPRSTLPDLATYIDLVHPDDQEGIRAGYAAFLESTDPHLKFEHRICRPDGEIVHVRGLGERSEGLGSSVLTGVVQDITGQIAASARLADLTEMQRIAGRAAKLGGWRVDLARQIVFFSEETALIHGFPPTALEFSVEETISFYGEAYRAEVTAAFERCILSGEPFDLLLPFTTAAGRSIWVRVTGEAEHDQSGSVSGLRGSMQDVSELLELRLRSEALAERLHNTLESISDGFCTIDRDWNLTYVNKEFSKILGVGKEACLGQNVWECFPDAENFRPHYEAAVRNREKVHFDEFYAPIGKWLRVNAYPTDDGLAVYFQDVTRERRQEERIRLSEERFATLARVTNDVIWDWDLRTNQLWWNESFHSHFGYDPEAVEPGPESWSTRIHPADRDRVTEGIHHTIDGSGSTWLDEYRFITADGRVLTVMDRGSVIRNGGGEAVRMIGSMMDITHKREIDEQLGQSQRLEAIGQLTGGVAHDFNNLLTVILGNSELLREELKRDPDLYPLAQAAFTAAERGAQLTNRLLAFSRQQALEPRTVDPRDLLKNMSLLVRRTLSETIDIEIVASDDLWQASIDPGQLEVALLNLAINARDAMPGGGRLTIEARNAWIDEDYAAEHIEVTAGPHVMISVSDTGSGMPQEVLARAFEPFFTTKEVGLGSGLGLSMVYGFVKQSQGHVKIYSEVGSGTSVKIYFPRAAEVEEGPLEVNAQNDVTGGHEHILVVEDDDLVQRYVIALLTGLGYNVTAASSGPEALEILRSEGPRVEVLFTDIVMPGGMNGRELADAARQIDPDLRVLYTSGYTEDAIVHHGRLDPGVSLLSKPYRRQDLAAKLRMVLSGPP